MTSGQHCNMSKTCLQLSQLSNIMQVLGECGDVLALNMGQTFALKNIKEIAECIGDVARLKKSHPELT